jgi:hypothetical protein
MKTFLEFITEGKSLRERVQPAIEHTDEEGKVQIKRGKRGEDHAEIRERHMKEPGKPLPGRAGFYDPEEQKFYTREEMGNIDSTRMLTPKERDDREERLEKKYAGGQSSTDNMTDFQRTKQMLRYTENLEEGNPLSRMRTLEKEGRHFIAISTERPGLTKKQVAKRNEELMSMAREAGFGVRKTEGRYEGNKESSHVIHARAAGREAGAELVAFGRRAGKHFDQDSVLHHNGKTARLIGTNTTGFPGMDKSEKVGGELKYNPDEKFPFQTELRPSKKRSPARFTTE